MSTQPLVSVIVPVYNAAAHLERCVQSLMDQTYRNIEIILINDGSTDNSGKICDALQQTDRRVRAIHGSNSGVSRSRNMGIRASRGEFIQFVDSDDYVDSDMSELLVAHLLETNADLAITGYVEIEDATGSERKYQHCETKVLDRQQFLACFFALQRAQLINSCWNKLYRRTLVSDNNLEFAENLHFAEDEMFNLRYMALSHVVTILTETPYKYVRYSTGDNLSRRYRPNMYEIALWEMHLLSSLFHDSESGLAKAERHHALNLATQVVPYLANSLARSNYRGYVRLSSRIRRDEVYVRRRRDLRPGSAREWLLLALFRSSRFEAVYLLGVLKRMWSRRGA